MEIIGVFLLLVSIIFFFVFRAEKRKLSDILDAEFDKIGKFTNRYIAAEKEVGGLDQQAVDLISVSGRVEADEHLVSPLSNTECVYYDFEIKREIEYEQEYTEEDEDGNEESYTRIETKWESVTDEKKWKDFYLNDGSGKIRIDLQEAKMDIHNNSVEKYEREIPDNFMEFISDYTSGRRVRGYKFYEKCLVPGEELFIMGGIKIINGEAVIDKFPDRTFLISDRGRENLIGSSKKNSEIYRVIYYASGIIGGILIVAGMIF